VLIVTFLFACILFLEWIPCGSLDVALNRTGCFRRLRGNGTSISGVAISPDAHLVAVRLYDEIRIWNPTDGSLLRTLDDGTAGTAWCLAFNPDARLLASGCAATWPDTYFIRVWDVTNGSLVTTIPHPYTTSIAFSPDGKTLASASHDRLLLWDMERGSSPRQFGGYPSGAYLLTFSPDGAQIATVSSADGSSLLRTWRTVDGTLLDSQPLDDEVKSLAFSADAQTLMYATISGNLFWWTSSHIPPLRTLSLPIREAIRQAEFSTNGQFWATAHEYFVDLWATADGSLLRSFRARSGRTSGIAVSSDGALIVAGTGYDVEIWRRP